MYPYEPPNFDFQRFNNTKSDLLMIKPMKGADHLRIICYGPLLIKNGTGASLLQAYPKETAQLPDCERCHHEEITAPKRENLQARQE
ncbi:hypothetical protein NECAME_02016 [Necator americanus]|uniref:Uncharacterized protein n=1 Tax=Necator americanus TaxID=51031 RepID=W2TKY6_NECAM|nr:hypothetical protein NECAME_02016 [Necator americanus]ETN82279.1 hypothetical protein NECAME_02016 [Necator americanus]